MSKREINRKINSLNGIESSKMTRMHIPRASLSSSTSSSKSSSSSAQSQTREFSPVESHIKNNNKSESDTEGAINHLKKLSTRKNHHQKYLVHKAPKPSSLHSLSSASSSLESTSGGSNQSNYSANSMLLSVKNLENFNQRNSEIYNQSDFDHRKQMLANIKNILSIEENLTTNDNNNDKKKKEVDQLSTTSSATNTNFTVITFNGFNREQKKSRSICRRRHQVTLVIVIMTIILFFGISSAVCMLEMRYKKMPR